MKRFTLLCSFLLLFCTPSVFSQEFYPLGVGAAIVGKAGVNAGEIPDGFKTEVSINPLPDFLISAWYIISPREDFGVALDFGYTTNSYIMKPHEGATDDTKFKTALHYLSFQPYLRFKMFNLGLGVGIPLGGKTENLSGSASFNVESADMNTLLELRLLIAIPIYIDATGVLSFLLTGAYQLNGVSTTDDQYNPKVASAGIGLRYNFRFRFKEY